jgi:hypothetical protein
MITKNKPLIVLFAIALVAYLITDLFYNDAILYLVGGALGVLLKPVGLHKGFYVVWLIILIGIVVLYQRSNIKVLKWLLLILIWIFLYLVDVALYEILPDITSSADTYLHIGLSVLIKSALLAWIYYRGNKKNRKRLSQK